MTSGDFINFQAAADKVINIGKLNISTASSIRITRPGIVYVKRSFSDIEDWERVNILKKGKTLSDIMNTPLTACEDDYKASPEKIKDLEAMISYLPQEHRQFYVDLCRGQRK